jgi:predicted dehydrogenase
MPAPLRVGLVGTGHWARITHAPALASTEGIEFVGVWGRDGVAARALAAGHGAVGFLDVAELFEAVDAVAFSVPPDVQCTLAVQAAGAGKHVLLEKPIATSLNAADALVRAVEDAGVASIVFFTARFDGGVRAWLADLSARGGWAGGSGIRLGSVLSGDSPFNTPWRQEKGGLWDIGPHVVSLLWAALGPVVRVRAEAGSGDLAHLVLRHAGGQTSTVTVTLSASVAAEWSELFVWGDSGRSEAPAHAGSLPALRVALSELAGVARAGEGSHPCDVHFGREIVRVLAEAEGQMGRDTPPR